MRGWIFKMAKENKLKTPDWILKGYNSPEEYEKASGKSVKKKSDGKTYKIKKCPKCGSDKVNVVLSNSDSEEGGGKEWECRKCKWEGKNIKEEEVSENEFLDYMDKLEDEK